MHQTFAARKLILRCLTGSHMTILSWSNNSSDLCKHEQSWLNLIYFILFYSNFRKGHYFILWVRPHIFDEARFFLNEWSNLLDSLMKRGWKKLGHAVRYHLKNCQAKHNPQYDFLSLNTTTVLNNSNNRTRYKLKNTNTLKFYWSNEPARGF